MWHPLFRPSLIMSGTSSASPANADSAVVFLGHWAGGDGTTTATDSAYGGDAPHTITFTGGAASPEIDTAVSKFGGSSLLFGNDSLQNDVSIADTDDVAFAGDFTKEFWFYAGTFDTNTVGDEWEFYRQYVDANNYVKLMHGRNSTEDELTYEVKSGGVSVVSLSTSGELFSTSTWYHIAVTRLGNEWDLWIDGASVANATATGAYPNLAAAPAVAGYKQSTNGSQFNFDEHRITDGYAWYRNAFNVPTAAFTGLKESWWDDCVLYLPMDGADEGTKAPDYSDSKHGNGTFTGNSNIEQSTKKYGNASLELDGTGDYVTYADSANWDFPNLGAFTMAGWVNLTALSGYSPFLASISNPSGWMLAFLDPGELRLLTDWTTYRSVSWSPSTATWYHVACTRDTSGHVRFFIDGTQTGSTVTDITGAIPSDGNGLHVGGDPTVGGYTNGYLDDWILLKGQALWTSNFTPPTKAMDREADA